jgi:hypothetical protein
LHLPSVAASCLGNLDLDGYGVDKRRHRVHHRLLQPGNDGVGLVGVGLDDDLVGTSPNGTPLYFPNGRLITAIAFIPPDAEASDQLSSGLAAKSHTMHNSIKAEPVLRPQREQGR